MEQGRGTCLAAGGSGPKEGAQNLYTQAPQRHRVGAQLKKRGGFFAGKGPRDEVKGGVAQLSLRGYRAGDRPNRDEGWVITVPYLIGSGRGWGCRRGVLTNGPRSTTAQVKKNGLGRSRTTEYGVSTCAI